MQFKVICALLGFDFGEVCFGEGSEVFRRDGVEGDVEFCNGDWLGQDEKLDDVLGVGDTIIG